MRTFGLVVTVLVGLAIYVMSPFAAAGYVFLLSGAYLSWKLRGLFR